MNYIIQNILVYVLVAFALIFLVRKFIWKSKKISNKTCGDDKGCACH
ncbi:FeoB-associated Cys-rich membrane protein [Hyunsoonleella aestuarii]|nr:FeoB-associated Cys-rich membrane protein [Hyunsoonleella aestuarii]